MSLHRFITRLLIVALMIGLFTCCKSSKTVQTSKEETKIEEIKDVIEVTEKTTEIEWYDGLLGGNLPIIEYPKTDQDSIVTKIESRGIELDLTITKKGISYKAKAKPTANIKETEKTETKDNTRTVTESKKEEEKIKEKESPFKPPFYVWIAFVIVVLFFAWRLSKRVRV